MHYVTSTKPDPFGPAVSECSPWCLKETDVKGDSGEKQEAVFRGAV